MRTFARLTFPALLFSFTLQTPAAGRNDNVRLAVTELDGLSAVVTTAAESAGRRGHRSGKHGKSGGRGTVGGVGRDGRGPFGDGGH